MNITGGDAIAKMLSNEGVEYVFGIIDGTYFGFYSSLRKYGIELISPRHEASAAHMAGAYARLTGKLGVCMASNGPGVANLLTGIAVENAEGNRVLAITSARRPEISYPDRGGTYQCFDQVGSIQKLCKYSEAIKSFDRVIEITRQAFRKAYEGRPGVVHIDCPETIMNGKSDFDESQFLMPNQYRYTDAIYPSTQSVQKAYELISKAKFPIIHAGSGVVHARAYEELKLIADYLKLPVTTSWGARGVVDESNELAISMVHVEANNEIRSNADLVLVLGSRMGETDWWGKAPNWNASQTVIQVDIDMTNIGRNKAIDLGIVSDLKIFLQQLYQEAKKSSHDGQFKLNQSEFSKIKDMMNKHRSKLDQNLEDVSSPLNTAHIPNLVQKIMPENSPVVFDGGNTAVWGQFFFTAHNANMLGTPKMGMLGAGVGQALGAAVAHKGEPVYCIIGDGAMGFHMQEIETAVRNDLPVIYIVATDKQWGMVKMNQQFALKPIKTMIKKSLSEEETINADFCETKWDDLARSMGALGYRVSSPTELENALKDATAQGQCAVIHVDVNPVKHMWAPSLMHFKKMHEEPKGK